MAVAAALVLTAGVLAGALATGSGLSRVLVGIAVAAPAAAAVALVLWRQARAGRTVRRLAEAHDRFSASIGRGGPEAALAAAVEVLLPQGRLVRLHLTALDAPAAEADDLTELLVRDTLATGRPAVLPDGTTGRETARRVALPVAVQGRRVGAAVLRLPDRADDGLRLVQQLLHRVAPVLAADDRADPVVPAAAAHAGSGPEPVAPTVAAGTDAESDGTAPDRELRDLVARAAHDLRTPLNTLAGMVETLVQHGDELAPATRAELHAALQRSTRRVAGWITDLLDAAVEGDPRPVRPVRTPLLPLLEEAVTISQAATAGLRVEVAQTDVHVTADPGSVVRVVSNLLANAGQHAAESASVEIEARGRGDEVEVSVRDHGAGWAGADTPGPARTGDRDTHLSGLGIGLTSVRAQVERWGGRLELDRTPGGGATVRFTLPRPPAAATGWASSRNPDWTIAGRESVLRGVHRTP